MKVSAYFRPVEFPEFMASVEAAESNGYARVWVPDSQMIWENVYVYMTSALAATERVQVGTGVTQFVTRNFTVGANAHGTLAKLHPGRVIMGVGRGDSSVRTLGLKPMLTSTYAETVPKVRALLDGETVDFAGTPVRFTWCEGEHVLLMLAATGPRNLRLAGALADIVQLQVGAHPAAVRWAIESVREGAVEAGRDPAEVEISVMCGMWVSDDLEEAYREVRWAPVAAANHIEGVAKNNPEHRMPEELLEAIRERPEYDYYEHCQNDAEHTDHLTARLIENFAIVGTPERCLERIADLAELGVGEIAACFLNGALDQMSTVGQDLMDRVAQLRVAGAA